MTQNIYDDPQFFQNYSRLPRSVDGLAGAPEWPTLRGLLPPLAGTAVLDLGCGFGWFCRWARENGAGSVHGIDVSERMLSRARAETSDAAISYERADMEALQLPATAFDLAYSSLAFHYIDKIDGLFSAIHAALKPGGRLVFSVEHPIVTAPARAEWITGPAGNPIWPLNRYLEEGERRTDWLAEGVIKQHRITASYVNALIRASFAISSMEEWSPSSTQVASNKDWAKERERPFFLLMACDKQLPAEAR